MSPRTPAPQDGELRRLAQRLRYPPTPDLAGTGTRASTGARVPVPGRRGFAWAVAVLVLALLLAFSVPAVRAGILDFFQIGAVRVFPTAPPAGTSSPLPTQTRATDMPELFDLAGETTLEAARAGAGFPILLPTYPADLGPPDRVYLQEDGPMVILVWLEPGDSGKPFLSLHEIAAGAMTLTKMNPRVIEETQVNGQYALWAQGPYMLETRNGNRDFFRLVAGNTLIWEIEKITYRLETSVPLEEAVKIAESLK